MAEKPLVVVDPNFRRMREIFSPGGLARLHDTVQVVWGQDDTMPLDEFIKSLPEAIAVVTAGWRYGDILHHASKLRAIMDVAGAFPRTLNYQQCYDRAKSSSDRSPRLRSGSGGNGPRSGALRRSRHRRR